ncbi:hypothetical protein ACFLZ4_02480 [Patescibacteria group bacterium]
MFGKGGHNGGEGSSPARSMDEILKVLTEKKDAEDAGKKNDFMVVEKCKEEACDAYKVISGLARKAYGRELTTSLIEEAIRNAFDGLYDVRFNIKHESISRVIARDPTDPTEGPLTTRIGEFWVRVVSYLPVDNQIIINIYTE